MIEFLYKIDLELFYFINHNLSNSLFDKFFVFITEVKHWYLVYVILLLICFIKGGKAGKIAAVGSILLISMTDQFSSSFLKNLVGRIRPCNALSDVNILVGCTGSYSFPSSHAVNNFAVAFFFGKFFPKLKKLLIVVAAIVAFSRPYVGVHYPSDILAGALFGGLIGYYFSSLLIYSSKKLRIYENKI